MKRLPAALSAVLLAAPLPRPDGWAREAGGAVAAERADGGQDGAQDEASAELTLRVPPERLDEVLEEAANLGEVVQIEAELTRRTADLESLQARLAALRDTVQNSTVVLRLDSGQVAPAAGPGGFLDGLRAGWAALLAALAVLATMTGALLPFLPLLTVGGWLVLRSRRRRPAAGSVAA